MTSDAMHTPAPSAPPRATHASGSTETPTAHRCVPTRRAVWLLALGAVALLATPLWSDLVYVVLAWDAAVLFGLWGDFAMLRRGLRLEVSRERAAKLTVGVENPVTVRLVNRGDEPLRVWARDAYPGEFEARGDDLGTNDARTLRALGVSKDDEDNASDDDAEVEEGDALSARGAAGALRRLAWEHTPGGRLGPGLEVKPGSELEVTYGVTPTRRGDFGFGDVHVRVRGPLGLATLEGAWDARAPVKVYPNVQMAGQGAMATGLRDRHRLGLRSVRRAGGAGEFAQLRDYVQGDPYRDINWKATARRRKPVTQVYEAERSQSVVLCVDVGQPMAARVGDQTRLDHAIDAALWLAYAAIKGDDRVGLLVFGESIVTYLPPSKGQAQYRRILQALYGVQAQQGPSDYAEAVSYIRRRLRQRSLVVLFTDVHDEAQSRPLVDYTRLLMPRHLPLCVTLHDANLLRLRHAVPDTLEEVFDRAVATELLRGREVLKRELVQAGAKVIDCAPGAMTVEAVNAYVDVKRRRRL